MNKKGNVLDILWIAVMLFGVIVSFVLLATVGKEVNDDIIAGGDLNATSEVPLVTVTSGLPTWLDNGIMFLFIGLVIGLLVSAGLVDVSPVFFVLAVVFFMVFGVVVWGLQEFGSEFVGSDVSFVNMLSGMPNTTWLLNHYFYVFIIVFFLAIIVLFSKRKVSVGQW